MDERGAVIDCRASVDVPASTLKEITSLSYDIHRVVETIARELGYEMPRYITLRLDDYEVTVFSRHGRVLVVLIRVGEGAAPASKRAGEAAVES